MTKQVFQPSVKEDLNRPHKVTLTEGQISTILYALEGYVSGLDESIYDESTVATEDDDSQLVKDIDKIFDQLEGVVDSYYNVRKCIIDGTDYADCVDTLVERM